MTDSAAKHESEGVSLRGLAAGAGVVAAAIAFGIAAAYVVTRVGVEPSAAVSPSAAREGAAPKIAPPPVLQVEPARDIAAFREEKKRLLDTYGWVDREHGIVRIPVERAMTLIVQGAR
jgi:hypothetical protein